MDRQHFLTFLSIAVIFIVIVGNIKYLHTLIHTLKTLIKQIVYLLVKVCSTTTLAEQNYESIKKINEELLLKNKRLREYIIEVHNQTLANTGRLRIITKNDSIGHFECDKDGECTWVNQAVADLFGVERSDMFGHGWAEAVLEEDRNNVVKNWQESIKYDIPYTYKYRILNKKTNKIINVQASSITIRDIDGSPIMFCGTISEV